MLFWLAISQAWSLRPDEGGLYSYDPSDSLMYVDGPAEIIRVHYSVDGPNVTLMEDTDASGHPDFAEEIASTAEEVLFFYESIGFEAPLRESEMGLEPLGGSDALDVYLVDFNGVGDGLFSYDECLGSVCSGFMTIENDFVGYGYPSLTHAIRVLTSHELFHGVQAYYNADQPGWMSEGMAVWAEHQFDPDVDDFYWFCDAYLEDTGRSIDRPPAGSVTAFSYGTALFFQFLTERHSTDIIVDLQNLLHEEGAQYPIDILSSAVFQRDQTLELEWQNFARWNLATGERAGATDSYWFAERLSGIQAEATGTSIQDENRFYPLAASYFRLHHLGGDLHFTTSQDPTGLVFSLHAVAFGDEDGPVTDPIEIWSPQTIEVRTWEDMEPGGYWLVGTYPSEADQSIKLQLCLGNQADIEPCLIDDNQSNNTASNSQTNGCACHSTRQPATLMCVFVGLTALFLRRTNH